MGGRAGAPFPRLPLRLLGVTAEKERKLRKEAGFEVLVVPEEEPVPAAADRDDAPRDGNNDAPLEAASAELVPKYGGNVLK